MRKFTSLYRNTVSPDDTFVIIEIDDNIIVNALTVENIEEAITTTSDETLAEKIRDYYAEKYRCFYAVVDPRDEIN